MNIQWQERDGNPVFWYGESIDGQATIERPDGFGGKDGGKYVGSVWTYRAMEVGKVYQYDVRAFHDDVEKLKAMLENICFKLGG